MRTAAHTVCTGCGESKPPSGFYCYSYSTRLQQPCRQCKIKKGKRLAKQRKTLVDWEFHPTLLDFAHGKPSQDSGRVVEGVR